MSMVHSPIQPLQNPGLSSLNKKTIICATTAAHAPKPHNYLGAHTTTIVSINTHSVAWPQPFAADDDNSSTLCTQLQQRRPSLEEPCSCHRYTNNAHSHMHKHLLHPTPSSFPRNTLHSLRTHHPPKTPRWAACCLGPQASSKSWQQQVPCSRQHQRCWGSDPTAAQQGFRPRKQQHATQMPPFCRAPGQRQLQ